MYSFSFNTEGKDKGWEVHGMHLSTMVINYAKVLDIANNINLLNISAQHWWLR